MVKRTDLDMSEVGDLVKELLQINFVRVSVTDSPKNCNEASHALAALGRVCEPGSNPILDLISTYIQNIVADDIGQAFKKKCPCHLTGHCTTVSASVCSFVVEYVLIHFISSVLLIASFLNLLNYLLLRFVTNG
jgi:hypothetical protein